MRAELNRRGIGCPPFFTTCGGKLGKLWDLARMYASALNLHLTPEQRGIVWGRIGHMAALRLMPEAAEWYERGGEHVGVGSDAARIDEVLEWQVRAALRAGDWATVARTIDRMPASLRNDPAWVYWRGRALQKEGREAEAREHFQRISAQFHFYGKLAAEELGQPIVLPTETGLFDPDLPDLGVRGNLSKAGLADFGSTARVKHFETPSMGIY